MGLQYHDEGIAKPKDWPRSFLIHWWRYCIVALDTNVDSMMLDEGIVIVFKVGFLVLAIQKFPINLNTKFVDVPGIFNLLDLKWNKKWYESKYMNVSNHPKVQNES